ncbi:MAG: hypothetical protein COW42_14490 [Deltaproteobacteria bacterium CG17_big_fil_post_rev_8_21_14_2_50_63_7]|nr:MAG: hypothetical protein COW42_14490 [Deltaproteobacteria bacterium CG17_big_fil_post_rev_8_21_14_2_50_63_7]
MAAWLVGGVNVETDTIHSAFDAQVRELGDKTGCWKRERNAWADISWKRWQRESRVLAGTLRSYGVRAGDGVLLVSGTRYEWMLAQIALSRLGAFTLSISPGHLDRGDLVGAELVALKPKPKVLIADGPGVLRHFLADGKLVGDLRHVVYFDTRTTTEGEGPDWVLDDLVGWPIDNAYEALDMVLERPDADELLKSEPKPKKLTKPLRTRVYSAGSRGVPRAVTLTHSTLLTTAKGLKEVLVAGPKDLQLLGLPLCHAVGQVYALAGILSGMVTAFVGEPGQLIDSMAELHPTIVVTVPRVYERIYTHVLSFAEATNPLKRAFFSWAVDVGKEASRSRQEKAELGGFDRLKGAVADRFVFRRLKAIFGRRPRYFVSAGGPLSAHVASFFDAAGAPILESYGTTALAGVSHIGRPDDYRIGTAGRALPGVLCRIGDNGEIWVKHSDEGLDGEWFKTGDSGSIDHQGYLTVDLRMADRITTSDGETFVPRSLEEELRAHPAIDHLLIFGDQRPFLTALVTLDAETLRRWGQIHQMAEKELSELTQSSQAYLLVKGIIDRNNREQRAAMVIKKFVVLETNFSIAKGELNDFREPRTKQIAANYRTVLDSFYDEVF